MVYFPEVWRQGNPGIKTVAGLDKPNNGVLVEGKIRNFGLKLRIEMIKVAKMFEKL